MGLVHDWRRLSAETKIKAAVVTAVTLAAAALMIHRAATPEMSLLYSDLDSSSAGEIIERLESTSTRYDVRGNSIFVPHNNRDKIRMSLAADGLPSQGQAGFELLDAVNAFSTTAEMFDATYWRAKEGELARTILATPGVKSARVHIAATKRGPFSRSETAPSAVATIRMSRGNMTLQQANAARFIIALAVPNLDPRQVAIVDAGEGVILAPGPEDKTLDLIEQSKNQEAELESSLVRLLEARVGAGNVRVKASIDIARESETIFERILDPNQKILMQRDSSESQETEGNSAGAVTVASNIPEGDANPIPPSSSKKNEVSESSRFEISERRRQATIIPGSIKRIQVAVLLNQPVSAEGDQGAAPARSAEELSAVRNLVSASIGFDSSRGDVISIESLPFQTSPSFGTEATRQFLPDLLRDNVMPLLQLLIPAIVALILGLFVLRPLLNSPAQAVASLPALDVAQRALPDSAPAQELPKATPIEEMQKVISEKKTESRKILTSWLEEDEAAA